MSTPWEAVYVKEATPSVHESLREKGNLENGFDDERLIYVNKHEIPVQYFLYEC